MEARLNPNVAALGFGSAANDYFDKTLTNGAKRQLRLLHVFKAAADIVKTDLRRNRLKLICFSTFPTTTAVASLAFIASGLTATSRQYRRQLSESFKEPVNYKLYSDFMSARFEGNYDLDTKKLYRHMLAQRRALMMQNLYVMTQRYPTGVAGAWFGRQLRKRMVKGELALVS